MKQDIWTSGQYKYCWEHATYMLSSIPMCLVYNFTLSVMREKDGILSRNPIFLKHFFFHNSLRNDVSHTSVFRVQ